MRSLCKECGAVMVDSLLRHNDDCSMSKPFELDPDSFKTDPSLKQLLQGARRLGMEVNISINQGTDLVLGDVKANSDVTNPPKKGNKGEAKNR